MDTCLCSCDEAGVTVQLSKPLLLILFAECTPYDMAGTIVPARSVDIYMTREQYDLISNSSDKIILPGCCGAFGLPPPPMSSQCT